MSITRTIARILLTLAGFVVAMAMVVPWALYAVGMHGVVGRPAPPERLASSEVQMKKWTAAQGVGAPHTPRLSPYSYVLVMFQVAPRKPGLLVAWWAASDYLQDHQRYSGMGWWHLSGAALTIWLTRNWTTEQLLSTEGRGSAG